MVENYDKKLVFSSKETFLLANDSVKLYRVRDRVFTQVRNMSGSVDGIESEAGVGNTKSVIPESSPSGAPYEFEINGNDNVVLKPRDTGSILRVNGARINGIKEFDTDSEKYTEGQELTVTIGSINNEGVFKFRLHI